MALGEFDLIARYFHHTHANDVVLGIGDDAAIVDGPPNQQLRITTDTLHAGVHFPEHSSAADIAFKTVAVNVSDIAAMGGTPKWATLNLSLPSADEPWLNEFSGTLMQQLRYFGIDLIGGDTTRGALSLTLTVLGLSQAACTLRRDAAQIDDLIVVTGTLGDARLGLDIALKKRLIENADHHDYLVQRLNRPSARLAHSKVIKHHAHAAIDLSDGLAQDLSHLLKRSNGGAILDIEKLPLSSALRFHLTEHEAWQYALAGGDDYELLFTVSKKQWPLLEQQLFQQALNATVIGRMVKQPGLHFTIDGKPIEMDRKGFQHF
jgi:thiamine-monophosphate kinase